MDSNFYFLNKKWPVLATLGAQAEKNLYQDPHTTKMKARVFAERLTKIIMAEERINYTTKIQLKRIDLLSNMRIIPTEVVSILHRLRADANESHHDYVDSFDLARALLQSAHELARWFVTVYDDVQVHPLPFKLPPKQISESELSSQLDLLSKQYNQHVKSMEDELNKLRKEYLSSEEVLRRREQSRIAASKLLSSEQIHDLIDSKLRIARQQQKSVFINDNNVQKHKSVNKIIAISSLVSFFIMVAIWYVVSRDDLPTNNQIFQSLDSSSGVGVLSQNSTLPYATPSSMEDTKPNATPSNMENTKPLQIKSSVSPEALPVIDQEDLDRKLFEVAIANDTKLIRETIEQGANPNVFFSHNGYLNYTPLMIAVSLGSEASVAELLHVGSDSNIGNSYYTPLSLAVMHNQENTIKVLIDHGADLDLRIEGFPLLVHAAYFYKKKHCRH